MTRKKRLIQPAIRFHELEAAFRKDVFPVAAQDPEIWRPLLKVFSPLKEGEQWMGYDVAAMSTTAIKHAVYFMGRGSDTKVGYFITLELVSPKGAFKLTISDTSTHSRTMGTPKAMVEPEKADLDVRATSQDFMDLIFIVAKSSI